MVPIGPLDTKICKIVLVGGPGMFFLNLFVFAQEWQIDFSKTIGCYKKRHSNDNFSPVFMDTRAVRQNIPHFHDFNAESPKGRI